MKDKQKNQINEYPVAVANFQPVVEPLERLELNAGDVFRELLDADPTVHAFNIHTFNCFNA